jgi:hypothetical protein
MPPTVMEMELRERITRLESAVEHMAETTNENHALLKQLNDAFQQARGAKWAFYAMAGGIGFLGGKGSALLAHLVGLPK